MRLGFLWFWVAGCATGAPSSSGNLQHKLDEMQRSEQQSRRKIEELEEKVFLLTDQLESRKAAAGTRSAPRLPVVTLRAPEPDKQTLLPEPGEEIQHRGDDIEYQGEARRAGPRPSLRLSGANEPRAAEPAAAAPSASQAPPLPLPNKLAQRTTSMPLPVAAPSGDHDNLGVVPVGPAGGSSASKEDPLRLYRSAHEDLRRERHGEAERAFRDFVRRFPNHDYADNAQYWLGETLYAQKRFSDAAPEFRKVVQHYPLGGKAADALLKLGFCLQQLGEEKKAASVLQQIGQTYPGTEAAKIAAQKLEKK